jgi:proteasome lid subunit RPN8/RPN11
MPHRPLRLPATARRVIQDTSRRAHPEEGCGYLIGPPGSAHVDDARPARNVHPGPRTSRYLVDPLEFMTLEEELDAAGRTILGIFHSHPASPAVPSPTDFATALPGLYYVVHDVRPGAAGPMRAWLLSSDGERFDEVLLEEE